MRTYVGIVAPDTLAVEHLGFNSSGQGDHGWERWAHGSLIDSGEPGPAHRLLGMSVLTYQLPYNGVLHRFFIGRISISIVIAACIGTLQFSLRRRLASTTGRSTCPKCGYDLHATPDRCPECGTAAPTP